MPHRRAMFQPSVNRIGAIALLVAISILITTRPAAMQEGPHRVGLVVQFPDRTVTTCVTFSEDQISGYEVLRRAGLELNIDVSSGLGTAICSINGVGCTFPVEDCFCQCLGGESCFYWSYWHLRDGQWEYSELGASSYFVRDGDVEGWRWSQGQLNLTADPPPVYTFEELCLPPTPTATPTDTPIPLKVAFTVDEAKIKEGECTHLRWQVEGASTVSLDGEPVDPSGSREVCPAVSTSYRLEISYAAGALERLVSVAVEPRPATPTPTSTPTSTPTRPSTRPTSTPTPGVVIHMPTPTLTPTFTPTSTPTATPTATPTPFIATAPEVTPTSQEVAEARASPPPATPVAAKGIPTRVAIPRVTPAGGEAEGQRPVSRLLAGRPELIRLLAFGLVSAASAIALGAISMFLWRRGADHGGEDGSDRPGGGLS